MGRGNLKDDLKFQTIRILNKLFLTLPQVEAAKQDRTVILTTHSMEEADILGDCIAIMAKGRLRCIGTSVRLKTKFGEGYKVSVSCGDNMKSDSDSSKAVKSFFQQQLGVECVEESKAYMNFNVPVDISSKMAQFFADLDYNKTAFGIVDVQLSMSTLEDVFLKVATKSEFEEAQKESRTTVVTLKSGENVAVRLGCEETLTSPNGATFVVKWGTDEDGHLIAIDTTEIQMEEQEVMVVCPEGVSGGQSVQVMVGGTTYQVAVPPGVSSGQQFKVAVKVPKKADNASQENLGDSQYVISADEVRRRVEKLHTPFLVQADALFRKNLSFQWKRRVTNCCLVLVPLFVLALVFGIQALLEILFLGTGVIRCPYCGPAGDAYGQLYCNKAASCVEFFFPNSSRQEYINVYGVDVVARCSAIAGLGPLGSKDPSYCYGNGNASCFQVQWATPSQFGFCPYLPSTIPTEPQLGYAPLAATRAKNPVLLTSDPLSKGFATLVGNRSAATNADTQDKRKGAMSETNRQLFQLFATVPWIGCQGASSVENYLSSVCQILTSSGYSADVCCLDLTGGPNTTLSDDTGLSYWESGNFKGQLVFGVNYWTDMPNVHNDAAYQAYRSVCTQSIGTCNQQIMMSWVNTKLEPGKYGVRFGSGKGQLIGGFEVSHLLMRLNLPMQLQLLVSRSFKNQFTQQESFQCVVPAFANQTTMNSRYPTGTCINIEEGLAVLAQVNKISNKIHPIYNLETAPIPQCSAQGTCTFTGLTDGLQRTFYADTPGRWAQICDFYTQTIAQDLMGFQAECSQESASASQASSPVTSSCPKADSALQNYLTSIPCMCRWIYFARAFVTSTVFPSGLQAIGLLQLPRIFQCTVQPDGSQDCSPSDPTVDPAGSRMPAALTPSGCWRKHYHAYSIPEIEYATSIWPGTNFFSESAITTSTQDWWNQKHVLTADEKQKFDNDHSSDKPMTCEEDSNCWMQAGMDYGNFSFLAIDCTQVPDLSCFLQKMGNLSGLSVGCMSTNPLYLEEASLVNQELYDGQYSKYGSGLKPQEYIGAYNLYNSGPELLNVSVYYNDTTQVILNYSPNPTPPWIRLSQPINAIMDAFLNLATDASSRVYASLMGIREVSSCYQMFFLRS